MGLSAVYQQFLKAPSPQSLADNATLQYVTTLKSFSKPNSIINHLGEQQSKEVKKKAEKVISVAEGSTTVAVIVETTLEVINSGGAYLPDMDTFIIDKTATLPVIHFVHFDQNNKITQIRLSWDQGDLLKQMDVIGTRGKNWPIYSGKDQIKMITTSTDTANVVNPAPVLSPRGRNRAAERSASPSKKFIKDPHASLDLSQEYKEERTPSAPNAVAPRESAKPAPRDMSDIFAAGHEDYDKNGPDGSPRKIALDSVIAPKGAAHKRFQASRVFEEEESRNKPERQIYKTNPARYNHFDIGDPDEDDHFQYRGENTKPKDVPIRPKGGVQHKNVSHWDFDDVATPEKPNQKVRGQDVVHFSYDDPGKQAQAEKQAGKPRRDEETHFEFHDNGTPIARNAVPKPRKDQINHFDFNDEPSPAPRRIIARTKAASKLYSDPVFGDEEEEQPLQTISHNARKDMASQWNTHDESPVNTKAAPKGSMRKGMESHWSLGDDDVAPKPKSFGRGRKEIEKGFWDD